jgi:hypothetical protein
MKGAGCEQPLPQPESWTIKDSSGDLRKCQLMQPATEIVGVPAGEFEARRSNAVTWIRPAVLDFNLLVRATIGAMVRAVHHGPAARDRPTFVILEQLTVITQSSSRRVAAPA